MRNELSSDMLQVLVTPVPLQLKAPESRQVGLKLTDFMDMPIFEAEPYAKAF